MAGRVLYRYPATSHPRTHISHIPGLRPYPRPNEGNFETFNEVSQRGLDKGPDKGPDMAPR